MKNIGLSAFGVPNIGAVSVFGIGVDNELYFKVWSGAGGERWYPSDLGWLSLGGQQFDSVPAVVQANEILSFSPDLFATDLQGHALHGGLTIYAWKAPNIWPPTLAPWTAIGGVFNGPLEAAIFGIPFKGLALVGLGADSQAFLVKPLILSLGKILIFEPAIVSNALASTTFTVFGIGTDRQLYQLGLDLSQTPPKLTAWEPAGGCFISAPSVVKWSSSRTDVFGVGSNQQMYHRASENGAWLEDWETLGWGVRQSCRRGLLGSQSAGRVRSWD